jgi:hypothetical protein
MSSISPEGKVSLKKNRDSNIAKKEKATIIYNPSRALKRQMHPPIMQKNNPIMLSPAVIDLLAMKLTYTARAMHRIHPCTLFSFSIRKSLFNRLSKTFKVQSFDSAYRNTTFTKKKIMMAATPMIRMAS